MGHAPRRAPTGHRPAQVVARRPRPREPQRRRRRLAARRLRRGRAPGCGRQAPGRPSGGVLQRLAAHRPPLGRRPCGRGHRHRARAGHHRARDGPAPRLPPRHRPGRAPGQAVRDPGEGDRRRSDPPARCRARPGRGGRAPAAQRPQAPVPAGEGRPAGPEGHLRGHPQGPLPPQLGRGGRRRPLRRPPHARRGGPSRGRAQGEGGPPRRSRTSGRPGRAASGARRRRPGSPGLRWSERQR